MAPFEGSIVCPVLIGRVAQVDALLHLAEQAWTGRGQTAVIVGDAGIGKSRLVAEIKIRLRSRREPRGTAALILQGRCFEPDRVLPYAPLLDLLQTFVASCSADGIATYLEAGAVDLGELLPKLSDFTPIIASPGPARAPEQATRRLYHSLAQFFFRIAARQPLLLVIEDLQWSDDTSLDFLLYLARRIGSLPIFLVLTCRSAAAHAGTARLLAALERERLAIECPLTCLSVDEVDAMVRAIFDLGRPVRAEFLEALSGLTEGNPFFVEEVLKSLVTAGDIFFAEGAWDRKPLDELRIPLSVQVAVQQRLAGLSPPVRHLLDLAAVAGRRFDFVLLQRLTQQGETELLAQVKDLIAAQLVVEESADTFAFRHNLTRQAVYAALLGRERRALHHCLAVAMEHVYAESLDAHLGDLAGHFWAAEIWDKVLEYARRAAESAQALYAPRAAIEHWTQALAAERHLSTPPPPTFYRQRGRAYEEVGDFEASRRDYQQALDDTRAARERTAEWQSLLDLGFLWLGRDYQRAGGYFRQALELARLIGAPSIVARSLNRMGHWHVIADQPLEGQSYHEEALSIFDLLNDRQGLAETQEGLGLAAYVGGDLIAGARYYEQAAARYRELDDRNGLVTALTMLAARGADYLHGPLIWPATTLAKVTEEGELALKIARAIGWRPGEAFALAYLGGLLGARGEYRRALDYAWAGVDLATEIEHRQWLIVAHRIIGALHLDALDLATAQQHLEQALELVKGNGSLFSLRVTSALLGSTYVAQQDLVRAEAVLDAALSADSPAQTLAQRLLCCARAELALLRNDSGTALQIVDRLILSAANIEGQEDGAIPRLCYLRGKALAAQGRAPEAEAAFQAAGRAASKLGARPLLWRIQASLGTIYRAQGRRKAAEEAVMAAQTIVRELAGGLTDTRLRETFLRGAGAQIPRLPPPTPRRAAKQAFSGLTEREREVAALLALGQSNRALAAALVVTERTAAKHVENILSKLGFSARAQVASWAVETGLAKGADRTSSRPRQEDSAQDSVLSEPFSTYRHPKSSHRAAR